ncbi:nuclear envelope pore membrane protein POM 121 [Oryzias melastigma]|uniref:POM121 transmembrane nucleoporin n=1 Tax=Oryzias melastigma TaxID=30732 RepID=A0A3B3B9Q1_ORYME|nr:nuclear envelope pore membrane protein POM 121 [Oryzias melastigma]
MSPREKRIVLLSALGLFTLAFYFIPSLIYATLIIIFCCFACYYNSGESLLTARLGPNPRGGLNLHAGLRRWLADWGTTGLSVNSPVGTRISSNAEAESQFRQRLGDTGIYRREALASESFFYSPRDFLMGSYIGKHESPPSGSVRPRAGRNPREQLREKLSRPNHAVYTPNRRLSFAGEPLAYTSRFNITPQRHYPLQQPGLSSVGVLPLVRWDGFRQKNILSPRNSPAALSPVTVKIARPDLSSPRVDHLSCSRISRTADDPCSRESVLRVLKESRKREVEDEDRSFTTEQKSKRRRNDSGGSAHSAFEPLLPNGAPSQLVPKPGTLKRGIASLAEESSVKRSRTSSISSGTGAHASRESSGTKRNAIQSSYSSSVGLNQWKKPSTPSSLLSSPGSSRCQTPDVAFKKPREEDAQSPSSASSAKSEQTTSDKAPATSKLTVVPNVPVTSVSDSVGSGGKRKRKIQLVSSNRDDHISLPPPPELGYKVTAKDLDEEKKAAISKIQKVLETPAPEPEKPAAATIPTSTPAPSSTISTTTPTLSSLLAAPLPTSSTTTTIPVINLDPSPSSSVSTSTTAAAAAASPNPLLEALKMKINTAATSTSALSPTTVSLSTTPGPTLSLKSPAPSVPPASQPQPSSAPLGQPSAFTQVLAQISKAPSSSSPAAPVVGPALFGLSSQISSPSAPSTSTPVSATPAPSSSSSNPLLVSGFKPIFAAATTTTTPATSSSESKAPIQNFKPIFGEATATPAAPAFAAPSALTTTSSVSTLSAGSTPSIFGGLTSSSTAAPSAFSGFNTTAANMVSTSAATTQPGAQMAPKSLFGSWSAAATTTSSSASASVQPLTTGGTFQFGAAVTTTTSSAAASTGAPAATTTSQASFTFGVTKPNPQPASQSIFGFGQTTPNMTTTTASFGGFAMTSSTSTAAPTSTSTQSTFAFGKPAFEAPTTQPTFGSAAATAKPFNFGSSSSNATPVSNNTLGPFAFGAAPAATTTATFGTQPAKPAFGASSTGFAFGSTTTPSAAPSFGPATQTQSSTSTTFTFGGVAPQPAPAGPAQPASGGFNFGTAMPCPQFGAQVSNSPAPQMGGFNFGAAAADKPGFGTSTPSFGQSPAAGPIPFGSPGTPVQGFNPVSFGSPATPTFSIGAGSKHSGSRQRLQARRQHLRKK